MNYEQTRKKIKREFEGKVKSLEERNKLLEEEVLKSRERIKELETENNSLKQKLVRYAFVTKPTESQQALLDSNVPLGKLLDNDMIYMRGIFDDIVKLLR